VRLDAVLVDERLVRPLQVVVVDRVVQVLAVAAAEQDGVVDRLGDGRDLDVDRHRRADAEHLTVPRADGEGGERAGRVRAEVDRGGRPAERLARQEQREAGHDGLAGRQVDQRSARDRLDAEPERRVLGVSRIGRLKQQVGRDVERHALDRAAERRHRRERRRLVERELLLDRADVGARDAVVIAVLRAGEAAGVGRQACGGRAGVVAAIGCGRARPQRVRERRPAVVRQRRQAGVERARGRPVPRADAGQPGRGVRRADQVVRAVDGERAAGVVGRRRHRPADVAGENRVVECHRRRDGARRRLDKDRAARARIVPVRVRAVGGQRRIDAGHRGAGLA
jgi:hypothetical protein